MVVLLGFVDDVVELKWRYKLVVPIVASLPLLIAYKG
jgi:UDP-N-acetylglucosamine--dolichyl-phosphate N-acetylglucosaminephosphotransferase